MSTSNPQINDFPSELLTRIFSHIDSIKELLRISCTCRKWRTIIVDSWFQQYRFRELARRHLIGYWKFDKSDKLGHDSSGILKDRYTFTGQPKQSTCFLGSCASFDEQSSIDIPVFDISAYQTDYFCVSIWLRTSCPAGTYRTAIGAWKYDNNHWLHLGHSNNCQAENQVMISPALVQYECSVGPRLRENLWYHLVALVSRSKQTLYINGKLKNTLDMSTFATHSTAFKRHLITDEMIKQWQNGNIQLPHTLHIGAKCHGQNFWVGEVADISIWNRHLEEHEIKAIYEQHVPIDKINMGEYILNKIRSHH